jgi:hypothetical protein
MKGSARVGHDGVENLSNEELIRFGGPNPKKEFDPIRGYREHQDGDDIHYPGSNISINGGHHRIRQIRERVKAGKMPPDTLIEFLIDCTAH